MRIDTRHLSAIEIIRREGGLTRAAAALSTSQPALSRLVSDLEARLDAPLFDRSTRPWTLTKLGDTLARQGAAILRAQDRAAGALLSHRSGAPGILRLAGPQFFTDGVVVPLLPDFAASHDGVSVELSYGYDPALRDAVRSGRADLAIYPLSAGPRQDDLAFTPLMEARNVIACREGHPILRLTRPRPLALLDYGWIFPPGNSPLAADMQTILSDLQMEEAEVVLSGGSPASVFAYLARSEALAVLPEAAVDGMGGLFRVRKVPIETQTPRRVIGLLTRPRRELDRATLELMAFLEARLGNGP